MIPTHYECIPRGDKKKTLRLSLVLMISAFLMFLLSHRILFVRALLQLIAVILLFLFIQILIKFLLTEYRYVYERGRLTLFCRQGKKELSPGFIVLESDCVLMDRKSYESRKKELRHCRCYGYCPDPFGKDPHYLLYSEKGGKVLLVFEPDETLVRILRESLPEEG